MKARDAWLVFLFVIVMILLIIPIVTMLSERPISTQQNSQNQIKIDKRQIRFQQMGPFSDTVPMLESWFGVKSIPVQVLDAILFGLVLSLVGAFVLFVTIFCNRMKYNALEECHLDYKCKYSQLKTLHRASSAYEKYASAFFKLAKKLHDNNLQELKLSFEQLIKINDFQPEFFSTLQKFMKMVINRDAIYFSLYITASDVFIFHGTGNMKQKPYSMLVNATGKVDALENAGTLVNTLVDFLNSAETKDFLDGNNNHELPDSMTESDNVPENVIKTGQPSLQTRNTSVQPCGEGSPEGKFIRYSAQEQPQNSEIVLFQNPEGKVVLTIAFQKNTCSATTASTKHS